MKHSKLITLGCVATLGLAAFVGSLAIAEDAKDAKVQAQPEMKLPPGWTADDMKAMVDAATPGKMQQLLGKEAGEWHGKHQMWMPPGGGEPMRSQSKTTITPIMDGRYTRIDVAGEMPGMGPYTAQGIYGYDNVTGKFVSTWIDNQSTGIMTGEGELTADGKSITWQFAYNCPLTKKPAVMRQTETVGGNNKTLEMFGADPKTGKEFQMMRIDATRE